MQEKFDDAAEQFLRELKLAKALYDLDVEAKKRNGGKGWHDLEVAEREVYFQIVESPEFTTFCMQKRERKQ